MTHELRATARPGTAAPRWLKILAYTVAVFIAGLNAWLLIQTFKGWL